MYKTLKDYVDEIMGADDLAHYELAMEVLARWLHDMHIATPDGLMVPDADTRLPEALASVRHTDHDLYVALRYGLVCMMSDVFGAQAPDAFYALCKVSGDPLAESPDPFAEGGADA